MHAQNRSEGHALSTLHCFWPSGMAEGAPNCLICSNRLRMQKSEVRSSKCHAQNPAGEGYQILAAFGHGGGIRLILLCVLEPETSVTGVCLMEFRWIRQEKTDSDGLGVRRNVVRIAILGIPSGTTDPKTIHFQLIGIDWARIHRILIGSIRSWRKLVHKIVEFMALILRSVWFKFEKWDCRNHQNTSKTINFQPDTIHWVQFFRNLANSAWAWRKLVHKIVESLWRNSRMDLIFCILNQRPFV